MSKSSDLGITFFAHSQRSENVQYIFKFPKGNL